MDAEAYWGLILGVLVLSYAALWALNGKTERAERRRDASDDSKPLAA